MHYCNICNYYTDLLKHIKKHYNTQKHINNVNSINNETKTNETKSNETKTNTEFICIKCSKQYKYLTSLKKHQATCNKTENNSLIDDKIELIKKDFEHKLEIEKLKCEYELKLKNQEVESLKQLASK